MPRMEARRSWPFGIRNCPSSAYSFTPRVFLPSTGMTCSARFWRCDGAMLTVEDALGLILDHAQPLAPAVIPTIAALGCVLAEKITSDIDSPPHDKAIVDGYALIAADIRSPNIELQVLEEVTAGEVPTKTVEPGTATRIMTGAPLPRAADAVVMVEHTQSYGDKVRIQQPLVKSGQNIMRRASSLARGQTVLSAGKLVRGIELGLLAEVGRAAVSIVPRPRVAVLVTGNELVESSTFPLPGQIRNSNRDLLHGLVEQAGGIASQLGIACDNEEDLTSLIGEGLSSDVLVLSGGVSAGVLDLVPATLQKLGVQQLFHKVNLKPGKPLWYGVKISAAGSKTLVFGLPGNPVSSLVCFELFVRPT